MCFRFHINSTQLLFSENEALQINKTLKSLEINEGRTFCLFHVIDDMFTYFRLQTSSNCCSFMGCKHMFCHFDASDLELPVFVSSKLNGDGSFWVLPALPDETVVQLYMVNTYVRYAMGGVVSVRGLLFGVGAG